MPGVGSERCEMSQQPYGNAGYKQLYTRTHTQSHVYLDQAVRRGLCGFISSNLFYAYTVVQWVALLFHSKKVLTELGHSLWTLNVFQVHSINQRHAALVNWRQYIVECVSPVMAWILICLQPEML